MMTLPSAIHYISSHLSWLYTLLYKLYYHSNLLQGERQACIAAHYAAHHYKGMEVLLLLMKT